MHGKYHLKSVLEHFPQLYLQVLRIKRRGQWSLNWIVSRDTDICIEGFPRSANSFAHAAFKKSQTSDIKTATHTHSSAQVRQATKWNIPTMVCIRQPRDAVCGLISFERQLAMNAGNLDKHLALPLEQEVYQTIERWRFFHSTILPCRKKLFIAPFADITNNFESVSLAFIDRFNLPYNPYDKTKLPTESLLKESFHVGPDPERDSIKAEVRTVVEQPAFEAVFDQCDRLYLTLTVS